MDIINLLLTNSKFWTTLFLLIQGILFYFVPAFPKEIWALIDLFIGTIISIILGKQIIAERKVKLVKETPADEGY